jgi:ketosteroid isomerase-like protein
MSQENVEIVGSMYESTSAAGRMDANFEVLDSEVEFHLSGALPDLKPVYRGHDGVRELNEQLNAPWTEISLIPDRMVDLGERVLVLSHFQARGRDGIEVNRSFAHVWTLADGLIVRLDAYADQQAALEAVGLDD